MGACDDSDTAGRCRVLTQGEGCKLFCMQHESTRSTCIMQRLSWLYFKQLCQFRTPAIMLSCLLLPSCKCSSTQSRLAVDCAYHRGGSPGGCTHVHQHFKLRQSFSAEVLHALDCDMPSTANAHQASHPCVVVCRARAAMAVHMVRQHQLKPAQAGV